MVKYPRGVAIDIREGMNHARLAKARHRRIDETFSADPSNRPRMSRRFDLKEPVQLKFVSC